MGVRSFTATSAGRVARWALHDVLHRSGSQLPGRIALSIDPQAIAHLRGKITCGSIVVCGTNGKTTTTNLIAAALEEAGHVVLCNRDGANMEAGVAGALLPRRKADWAVIEADELSCIHILPKLRPTYLVLLNLFRDQLDRAGEIDHVQNTLVASLANSPETTLVVCGDDPLSVGVAERVLELGTRVLTFGVGEDLGLPPDRVPEARFCLRCGQELQYAYRTYAQLGSFRCPSCDFARPPLDFAARDVRTNREGVSFELVCRLGSGFVDDAGAEASRDVPPADKSAVAAARGDIPSASRNVDANSFHEGGDSNGMHVDSEDRSDSVERIARDVPAEPCAIVNGHVHASFGGAYMVYNLLAASAAMLLANVELSCLQRALDGYDPHNGRLQHFNVMDREVVLNLAKNPTGLNQNIAMLMEDERPKAVYVIINDDYNDGRDISWLWDVDFERLALTGAVRRVMAGGHRANDLQVRLKYAGIAASIEQDVADAIACVVDLPNEHPLYVLTNYSALAPAKSELERLERERSLSVKNAPIEE